ncbi:MAG: ABC transporter substrate-binding protein [Sphaerochaetaceae bacterium]|nr:ABC transporter substrate-binding protein [Sphaerochaetaceae bacterium]
MKRLVVLIACLSLICFTVFATGTQEVKEEGPVKVSFWYSFGGNNRTVTEELVAKYNASQDKYVIEASFQGDYFESLGKFRTAVVSKNAPAVIQIIGEVLPQIYSNGIVENLEPYIEADAKMDYSDFIYGLTQEGALKSFGSEAFTFAIPFNRSTPIMYINQDMLDARGVKAPTTWDELRAAARKLTIKEGNDTKVYGFEVPIDWWFWVALVYQAGGSITTDDGKAANFLKAGTEALTFWKEMVDEGIMKRPPGKDYNAWETANTDFINGNTAMIITSTAYLAYLTENCDFNMKCIFLPQKEKYAVPTGGTFFVMWNGASKAEKEGGYDFIKWMTEVDQTILWSQRTGYMVVRESALKDPRMVEFLDKNPNYKVSYDQLKHTFQFPFVSGLIDIQREAIQPNIEAPIVGRDTITNMLENATKMANDYISSGR